MLVVLKARDYGPEGLKGFTFSPRFVRSNPRGTSKEARTGGGKAGSEIRRLAICFIMMVFSNRERSRQISLLLIPLQI